MSHNNDKVSLTSFTDIFICFSANADKKQINAENLSKYLDLFYIRERIDMSIYFVHFNTLRTHDMESRGWKDWKSWIYPGFCDYPRSASIVINRYEILITGGLEKDLKSSQDVFSFNTLDGGVQQVKSLNTKRSDHAIVMLRNLAVVIGGTHSKNKRLTSVE